MRPFYAALALLATIAAAPAVAQQPAQGRLLEVPAANAWQHAGTEMILPPRVAGFTRGEIRDLGDGELDVVAQYRGPDGSFATVYLFRTAVPDVALWFDRAAVWIALWPEYGLGNAALPPPAAFARPGATVPSGLRFAIDLSNVTLRSTALAIAPLGDHLLKIRLSSTRLERTALDAQLTAFIEGLRWPAPQSGERAAVPVADCAEPLRLRNARIVRPSMENTLLDALTGIPLEDEGERGPPPVYCREPGATLQYGVYRPNGSREAYLIALNDAGIALSLGEGLDLRELEGRGRGRRRISMTLLGRDTTTVLPSFDRLPPPAQAVSVGLGHRGETISVTTR